MTTTLYDSAGTPRSFGSEQEAQEAAASGKYAPAAGADVEVHNPQGELVKVKAEDVDQALAAGGSLASNEDSRQARAEEKFGGVGGGVLEGAQSAFKGVTAGLGPAGIAALFDKIDPGLGASYRDQTDLLDKAHGTIGTAGELAGTVLGGLATGGASGLAEGAGGTARALTGLSRLAPSTLIAGAGEAAEQAVGRGLAGVAARGAVEGGLYGAAEATSQGILDHDLTAEQIVSGTGLGGLLGGAGGAVLSAAERPLGKAFSTILAPASTALRGVARLGEGLTEGLTGAAEKLESTGVHEKLAGAMSALSGGDKDLIQSLTKLTPEGAAARQLVTREADEVAGKAAASIREHGDNLLRAGDLVTEEARGALKASYVEKAVAHGNEAATSEVMQGHLKSILEGTEELLTNPDGVGYAKSVESVSKATYRAMRELEADPSNAAKFISLDNLKRDTQKLASNGWRGLMSIADPLERRQAELSTRFFDSTAEKLRKTLEESSLWGKAAENQRQINEAWTRQIDASNRFHKSLTTEVGRNPDNPYLQVRGVDPQKAEAYIRGLTNPNKDLTHQAVKSYLESTRQLADAIHGAYELPAEKVAQVARIRESADKFHGVLEKTEAQLSLVNRYKQLAALEKDGGYSVAGAVLGGAVGGLPGAALGGAVGIASRPAKVIAQLAAVERMASRVDAQIGRSAKGLLAGAEKPSALSAVAKIGKKVTQSAGERFQKAIDHVEKMPQQLEALADRLGELSPALAASLGRTAGNSAAFLAGKVPTALRAPDPFQPKRDWSSVPIVERSRFLRYYTAVTKPMGTLEEMENGNVTYEAAEAMRVCQPKLYEKMQNAVVEKATAQAAKGRVNDAAVRRMGILFGIPTLPTQQPAVFRALQANVAQPALPPQTGPQVGSAPRRPFKLPSQQSALDRLEAK